jgi:energy-coupling factor transporter ATP-binding protein EcfA2
MAKSVKKPVETPPYLKQVRIRDYPPLRDAKVAFKPGLNIIIGSNGVGKTRFISLASQLVNQYEEQFEGIGCELTLGGPYEIKVRFEESPRNALARRIPQREFESLAIVGEYKGEKKSANMLEYVIEDLTGDNEFHYSSISIKHGIPTTRLLIVDENVELVIGKRGGHTNVDGGTRQVENVETRFVVTLMRSLIRVIRGGWVVIGGKETPLITEEKAHELIEQTLGDYLARFNSQLELYSPIQAIRHRGPYQIYRNLVQEEIIIKGLVLEYQVGNVWLPFSALSDGTRRIFYLIAELLAPTGMLSDSKSGQVTWLDKNEIIFLEEPELGIHPAQLHKLLSLIRDISRENQVIMTTHSPQVLDMLSEKELDRITVCTLDPKKGTQFHKLSKTKQQQAREYMKEVGFLSDYWRYSFLEETEAE